MYVCVENMCVVDARGSACFSRSAPQTVTEVSRVFMKENPRQKLPIDYIKYPGKMDHASVICLTVGKNNGDP